MNAQTDCDKKICYEIQSCEKIATKTFEISVPISITPFALPQKPEVKCASDVEITPGHKKCSHEHNSFDFTITQKINIDIPIKFGSEVCYESTCVEVKNKGSIPA
jgi:hypothetical protein